VSKQWYAKHLGLVAPPRIEVESQPDPIVAVQYFKNGKKVREELFATTDDVLAAFPNAKKVKDKYVVEEKD
jgi:hypothetical protein